MSQKTTGASATVVQRAQPGSTPSQSGLVGLASALNSEALTRLLQYPFRLVWHHASPSQATSRPATWRIRPIMPKARTTALAGKRGVAGRARTARTGSRPAPRSGRSRTDAQRFMRLSTRSSTTAGSASVEVSPSWSCSLAAIFRRIRRMILPERVLGRPGAHWIRSGVAVGPISLRTCWTSSFSTPRSARCRL